MSETMAHWLHHMLEAERATRLIPRAVLLYDELLADWRGTIARASQAAGLVWPIPPEQAAPEIEAFLQGSARHHNLSDAVLTGFPPVDGWANAAWAAFRRLAAAPEDKAALAVLNSIWEPFAAFRQEIMPEGMVIEVPEA